MTDIHKQADQLLRHHRAERDFCGEKLMKALRDAMPWGLTVDLGNGQAAELVPMNGNPEASQPRRKPIFAPGDHSLVKGEGPGPIGHEEWSFSFDWRLKNCDQDHIEVTVKISGGGGFA